MAVRARARLRERGTCVIFTSHRWGEVVDLADRITVFRNGEYVATRERVDGERGRDADDRPHDRPHLPGAARRSPTTRRSCSSVTGPARRAAARRLVRAAARRDPRHRRPRRPGSARALHDAVRGAQGDGRRDPRRRQARRIRKPADAIRRRPRHRARARGPQDRGADAADVGTRQPDARRARRHLRSRRAPTPATERLVVRRVVQRLQIRTRRPTVQEVGTLSGGNQQKVLIGRWLLAERDVLLLYDITRGVDVGTKHDIYELMVGAARRGQGAPLLLERDRGDGAALPPRARHARRTGRRRSCRARRPTRRRSSRPRCGSMSS